MATCYRHPDREAYVRCQRCERPICPNCQFEAAVGFLCPEDAGQAGLGATVSRLAPRGVRNAIASGKPIVTYTLIGICFAVWGLQLLPNSMVTYQFLYSPFATIVEPWRMLTSAFLHDPGSPLHILFNMYSLWIFGRELENVLGKGRFLALYLLSAIGGSVSVLWLSDAGSTVVGASGAIFGLMGAYFVVIRAVGGNTSQLTALIAINLISGFFLQGVSWQGHLGGLITGTAIAWIYAKTRNDGSSARRRLGVLVLVGLLVVIAALGVVNLYNK